MASPIVLNTFMQENLIGSEAQAYRCLYRIIIINLLLGLRTCSSLSSRSRELLVSLNGSSAPHAIHLTVWLCDCHFTFRDVAYSGKTSALARVGIVIVTDLQ